MCVSNNMYENLAKENKTKYSYSGINIIYQ